MTAPVFVTATASHSAVPVEPLLASASPLVLSSENFEGSLSLVETEAVLVTASGGALPHTYFWADAVEISGNTALSAVPIDRGNATTRYVVSAPPSGQSTYVATCVVTDALNTTATVSVTIIILNGVNSGGGL